MAAVFSVGAWNNASLSFTGWTFFGSTARKKQSPGQYPVRGLLPEGPLLGPQGLRRQAERTSEASMADRPA